ncbi:sugar-binding domain-containing protein [Devosia ginsengisoli]|nr:sugar-binding domain-containing protein [Devosia ginsengisoli]
MASIAELIAHGAVGDLAGHFLNARGVPLDRTINRQALAPELFSLSKIRHRLVVGGAPTKVPIVSAILATARG